jgi:lysophospholipase L1-like esterase
MIPPFTYFPDKFQFAIRFLILPSMMIFLVAATNQTLPRKLVVIGDSTATAYSASLYPLTGWAQVLSGFFVADSVQVDDKALSGRSSKSFYNEGAWSPIKAALHAGDFVFIQFGHNDEKTSDTTRGTLPATTFKKYLSIYITDVLSKGAVPVLLTPIERNSWKTDGLTLNRTHITVDGDYPKAIRELAVEKKVALIDANELTRVYLEKIGEAAANLLFMNLVAGQWANYPKGDADNTHLQEKGAKAFARLVADDILRQKLDGLDNGIKGAPSGLVEEKSKVQLPKIRLDGARIRFDLKGRVYSLISTFFSR